MVAKAQCDANYTFVVDSATLKVSFTNTSLGDSLKYYWSFGDGSPLSTDTSPVHQFAQIGWYFVCLNIFNADSSCADLKCDWVSPYLRKPDPCKLVYSYLHDTIDNRVVHFIDESTIDTPSNVLWVIGDSTIGTTKKFSVQFPVVGKYKVCMLQASQNCADSICKIIEILPLCQADFTVKLFADSLAGTGRIARFSNASTGGNRLRYLWKFGDGDTSTSANPIHYYATDGNYIACLIINMGNLCNDSICTLIDIKSTGIADPLNDFSFVKAYPLPFNDELKLELLGRKTGTVIASMFDIAGKKISEWFFEVEPGSNIFSLNIPTSLNQGIYIMQLNQNGNKMAIKLWK